MEFILGQTVYLDADPQSDCAILLLNADQRARSYFSRPSKLKPWSQP
jgi:hypothetical protein